MEFTNEKKLRHLLLKSQRKSYNVVQKTKRNHHKSLLRDDGWHRTKFHFSKIALEILHSVTARKNVKQFLDKIIHSLPRKKNVRVEQFLSVVTWPNVWEGVWRMVEADILRCVVSIANHRYTCMQQLLFNLERLAGANGRIIMAFLNQAPMADVFAHVWNDAQARYGSDVLVCEGSDGLSINVTKSSRSEKVRVRYLKNFKLVRQPNLEKVIGAIETCYVITFYPSTSARLRWRYK